METYHRVLNLLADFFGEMTQEDERVWREWISDQRERHVPACCMLSSLEKDARNVFKARVLACTLAPREVDPITFELLMNRKQFPLMSETSLVDNVLMRFTAELICIYVEFIVDHVRMNDRSKSGLHEDQWDLRKKYNDLIVALLLVLPPEDSLAERLFQKFVLFYDNRSPLLDPDLEKLPLFIFAFPDRWKRSLDRDIQKAVKDRLPYEEGLTLLRKYAAGIESDRSRAYNIDLFAEQVSFIMGQKTESHGKRFFSDERCAFVLKRLIDNGKQKLARDFAHRMVLRQHLDAASPPFSLFGKTRQLVKLLLFIFQDEVDSVEYLKKMIDENAMLVAKRREEKRKKKGKRNRLLGRMR